MEYTEAIHAERLIKILNKKDTCNKCPATKRFSSRGYPSKLYFNNPCTICQKFVGLKFRYGWIEKKCPCNRLGEDKAIKKSWIALEKKGYVK